MINVNNLGEIQSKNQIGESTMKRTLIKTASLVMVFGLLMSGCASTPTEEPAPEEPTTPAMTEDTGTANRALAVANEALDAARQAQSAAETALECCNENSTKLDRLFERTMAK